MEIPTAHPLTKAEALTRLGVHSRRVRNRIIGHVDLVHRRPGQSVRKSGARATATIACVTGSAVLQDSDGNTVRLESPFVIGEWTCNDHRFAECDITVTEAATFVVIDWNVRDLVFELVPRLRRWSSETERAVTAPRAITGPTVPSASSDIGRRTPARTEQVDQAGAVPVAAGRRTS